VPAQHRLSTADPAPNRRSGASTAASYIVGQPSFPLRETRSYKHERCSGARPSSGPATREASTRGRMASRTSKVARQCPEAISQSRSVQSALPLTTWLPSELMATLCTARVCPCRAPHTPSRHAPQPQPRNVGSLACDED